MSSLHAQLDAYPLTKSSKLFPKLDRRENANDPLESLQEFFTLVESKTRRDDRLHVAVGSRAVVALVI